MHPNANPQGSCRLTSWQGKNLRRLLLGCQEWWRSVSLLVLAAALLFAALAARAQPVAALDPSRTLTQYKLDCWQTEQGLPQNTVQALLQTRDGYFWVGTMDGLARFDGARFTVFDARSHPILGAGSVLALMEDSEGNLWIGCSGAAVIHRKGHFQKAFGDELTAGTSVWSFCQGLDGAVWAATGNGLIRWEKGTTRVYRQADGLPTDKLRSVAFDRDGVLWIGTRGGGLVSFSEGRFKTLSQAEGFPHQDVQTVLPDPDGGVWAATAGGGLAHVLRGKVKTYTTADGLPADQLTALARDAQGTLWIGTWGSGLCRMKDGRISSISSAGGLAGDQIWSLLPDREGGLWIGTWSGGLNRLRNRHFLVFGVPEHLSHDNARAVLRTRDGAMWVATAGGGLNRIEGQRVTTIRKRDGLPSDETSSLFEDRDGSLWVGTYTAGVARLKKERIQTYGTAEGLPGNDVRAIYRDRKGTLWVGTLVGLGRFDGGRFASVRIGTAPIEGVVSILEDRAGTLWFGTAGKGLYRFRDGQFTVLTKKDGLSSDKVLALHEDARGSLWIGTNAGGINRLRNGKIVAIRSTDGLWDEIVQTIIEDRAGNFWMTCNRGFFRAAWAELDAFAEGNIKKVTSAGYGPAAALRSTTFAGGLLPASAADAQGRLWFPTYKGLVIVDPANLPGANPTLDVRLEEITVNGASQSGDRAVLLPPGSAPLVIRFTAMTLLDADRVRFRYRMDGLAGDWISAGALREAFYPSLPHGNFRFRVEASIDGKSWHEAPTTLPITVQQFFYLKPWFLGLAILGALAAAWTTYRLRTLQLRRQHAEMERTVREKTEELRLANEHLSRLSFLDALTGLANRRRFDEALDEEWRRALRFGTSLALVMADIDAFKGYNDSLGHPEGDRCLAAVAGVFLRSVGRAGDLAARYGGEEFVILVPGIDHAAALAFAEKLRQECELLAIPHPASPTGSVVTLSLGVAVRIPVDGVSMDSLLADADAALYRAKHGGRNRVE
jgi:diguanylate cyclase (GGDEF)-like protein